MTAAGLRYTATRLILCEGSVDVAFVQTLIADNDLPRSHVRHSGSRRFERGGITKFGDALRAARVNPSFRRKIREVIIIADSDDDPAETFESVVRQLRNAGFAEPAAPRQWSEGRPRTAVFLLPPGASGAIETYTKEAARSCDPALGNFVDDFVLLAAMNWRQTEVDKLWLRTFISGRNRNDPSASTFRIISNNEPPVIDFQHASLNGLIAFLS